MEAIELIPTPGHTLSHHSLRFDSEELSVVIAGDAAMTRRNPVPRHSSPRARIRSTRARLAGAALLVLAIGSAPGLAASGPGAAPPQAASFRVQDVQGRTLELAELLHRGPVLLDFWATWCTPCVQSLTELEAWHRRYGPRGLAVIGVSIDGPRNFARVRPFVVNCMPSNRATAPAAIR